MTRLPSRTRRLARAPQRRIEGARAALCALWTCVILSGCWAPATTTRIVDGRRVVGRPVSEAAYTAYAKAALLDAEGKLERAAEAYEEAIDEDGDSPEAWTRLGAVLCRLGRVGALDAFEEAREIDPAYAPAHLETAECLRLRRHTKQALVHAQQAVALSPNDVDSTVLTARLLESLGRTEEARRWYSSLAAQSSTGVEAWLAIAAFATRSGDRPLELWARRELSALETARVPERSPNDDPLADALERGDLDAARALALRQGVSPTELALIALDVDALDAAQAQAKLVFDADPSSSDARVALLAAARRRGAARARSTALASYGSATRLGERAAQVFAAELRVVVGPDAADLFLEAHEDVTATPAPPTPKPPLPRPPATSVTAPQEAAPNPPTPTPAGSTGGAS